mgnify:CR=1 FL=1
MGFLSGFSSGIYCVGACLPIFIPMLLSQKQNLHSSFRVTIEFSLGRLLGCLLFGLTIGFLGEKLQLDWVYQVTFGLTVISGGLLVAYALGLIRRSSACPIRGSKIKAPVLLGFLIGMNACPPFLASLPYVFTLKSVLLSVVYFLMFFLGVSIYILPLSFLGLLTKHSWVQRVARFSGIFSGLYFICWGIRNLLI